MPVYRYKQKALDIVRLSREVPGALALGGTGAPIFVDVVAPASSKTDLDAILLRHWFYVGADLPSSPILDAKSFLHTTKNVSAGGTFVLNMAEAEKDFIVLTGLLIGAAVIEFPAVSGAKWTVRNTTNLAGFTVSLKVAGSVGVIVLGVGTMTVWSDGVDLFKMTNLVV